MQIPFIKILGYTIFNESYLLLTQQLKSETTSTFTEGKELNNIIKFNII